MSKNISATTRAMHGMIILVIIYILVAVSGIIYKQDLALITTFGAFIIATIALMFSIAIPVDDARTREIEKCLECFYKPIAQIIESPVNIENNFDNIISQLKEIRRYDHLAKDETTKGLFQQLTGTTATSKPNMICKMEKLLEHVQKDIKDYEKILDNVSSKSKKF